MSVQSWQTMSSGMAVTIYQPASVDCPGDDPEDPCEGEDPPAYCDEPNFCLGDPVPNPEIAPTSGQGVSGGRYGAHRNPDRTHNGLDIKADVGSSLYSMFDGSIYASGYSGTFGNYIIIQGTIEGELRYLLYAHLNEISVSSGSVTKGQKVGENGQTGNASGDDIVPHVHIEVKSSVEGKTFNQWDTHDPEDFMSTSFDEEGSPTTPSNCN